MKSALLAACGLLIVGCVGDDVSDDVDDLHLSEEASALDGDDNGPFLESEEGLFSIEAEHTRKRKAKFGKAWNDTSPSSASGNQAIKVTPNTGVLTEIG